MLKQIFQLDHTSTHDYFVNLQNFQYKKQNIQDKSCNMDDNLFTLQTLISFICSPVSESAQIHIVKR